jgi:hypothetical protein
MVIESEAILFNSILGMFSFLPLFIMCLVSMYPHSGSYNCNLYIMKMHEFC